ncbi:hypothetical protein L1887_47391 [Cichorium endivia]|nr:hypothetical protein L1887_47391 [Cichorium endivia]
MLLFLRCLGWCPRAGRARPWGSGSGGLLRLEMVLVLAAHHIGLDLFHLGRAQRVLEGWHAQRTEDAVPDDLLEVVAAPLIRMAQVGDQAAADGADAVTHRAVVAVQQLAGVQVRGTRLDRLRRALHGGRGRLRQRRQAALAAELEHQQAAEVAHPGRQRRVAADQRRHAAPAGHDRHVLFAVQAEADGGGDYAGLRGEAPQALSLVRRVGVQLAVGGALEHQVAGGAQGAAVPVEAMRHAPGLALAYRVPGQQGAAHRIAGYLVGVAEAGTGVEAVDLFERGPLVAIDAGDFLVGDVHQPGLRVERHGVPAVRAERARPHHHLLLLVARAGHLHRAAGGQIDLLGPGHLAELFRREQFAGGAIEHIEEAVLRRLHQHLARLAVQLQGGQGDLLGGGEVPGFARCGLVVAAAWAADLAVPRRAVAGADVQQIQLRVVGHAVPYGTAAAELPVLVALPGLGRCGQFGVLVGLGRVARHRVEAPGHLAGLGIVGGEEAAHAVLGAAVADDHLALHHPRRAGDAVGLARGGGLLAPDLAAGLGVQGDQATVQGADVDLAVPQGDAAVDRVAAGVAGAAAIDLGIELPQALAAAQVHGHHPAPGQRGVEHAVGHQRGGLQATVVFQIQMPGQAQLADVAGVDLLERAEALLGVGAAMAEPFAAVLLAGADGGLVDLGGLGACGDQQRGEQADETA